MENQDKDLPQVKKKLRLDYRNTNWMTFFNENRHLWSPLAVEWERLSKIYNHPNT